MSNPLSPSHEKEVLAELEAYEEQVAASKLRVERQTQEAATANLLLAREEDLLHAQEEHLKRLEKYVEWMKECRQQSKANSFILTPDTITSSQILNQDIRQPLEEIVLRVWEQSGQSRIKPIQLTKFIFQQGLWDWANEKSGLNSVTQILKRFTENEPGKFRESKSGNRLVFENLDLLGNDNKDSDEKDDQEQQEHDQNHQQNSQGSWDDSDSGNAIVGEISDDEVPF